MGRVEALLPGSEGSRAALRGGGGRRAALTAPHRVRRAGIGRYPQPQQAVDLLDVLQQRRHGGWGQGPVGQVRWEANKGGVEIDGSAARWSSDGAHSVGRCIE